MAGDPGPRQTAAQGACSGARHSTAGHVVTTQPPGSAQLATRHGPSRAEAGTCDALRGGGREQAPAVALHQPARLGLLLGAAQRRQSEVAPLQGPCGQDAGQCGLLLAKLPGPDRDAASQGPGGTVHQQPPALPPCKRA